MSLLWSPPAPSLVFAAHFFCTGHSALARLALRLSLNARDGGIFTARVSFSLSAFKMWDIEPKERTICDGRRSDLLQKQECAR